MSNINANRNAEENIVKRYSVKEKTGAGWLPLLVVSSLLISPLLMAQDSSVDQPVATAGAVPPPPGPYSPGAPAQPPQPPQPPQFRPDSGIGATDAGELPRMDPSERFGSERRYMNRTEFLRQQEEARKEMEERFQAQQAEMEKRVQEMQQRMDAMKAQADQERKALDARAPAMHAPPPPPSMEAPAVQAPPAAPELQKDWEQRKAEHDKLWEQRKAEQAKRWEQQRAEQEKRWNEMQAESEKRIQSRYRPDAAAPTEGSGAGPQAETAPQPPTVIPPAPVPAAPGYGYRSGRPADGYGYRAYPSPAPRPYSYGGAPYGYPAPYHGGGAVPAPATGSQGSSTE